MHPASCNLNETAWPRCNWRRALLHAPWFQRGGTKHRSSSSVSNPPSLAADERKDASNSCKVSLHFQPERSVQGVARDAHHYRWGGPLCPGEKNFISQPQLFLVISLGKKINYLLIWKNLKKNLLSIFLVGQAWFMLRGPYSTSVFGHSE